MEILKLCWLGTRTDRAGPTAAFFRDVLGLRPEALEEDFWLATLPDGGKLEIFGPANPQNRHFDTGPVAGFLVEDVAGAAAELRAAGAEVLHQSDTDEWGNAWVHFRAPDGNVYELTQDPGVSRS